MSLAIVLFCLAGAAQRKVSHKKNQNKGKPVVQEVSPPNWWSALPNPMLLLQGRNLLDADISTSAPGISVRRTKFSANGHWAFVWLDISGAPPQKLNLLVHTAGGKVSVPYTLEQRHSPGEGFQGLSPADVVYLLLPDRFADGDPANDRLAQMSDTFDRANPNAYHGGDLAGIQNHLDYLQQLGVTALWVTPLAAQSPHVAADYSGYAPVNLYQVNPHFGTLQAYQNLAGALHQHGLKLVLDMVLNHVGPYSPWVADSPAPDWFHGTPEQHLQASGDFATIANPHASWAQQMPVVDGWLGNTLPDLNQSNPLVKQYLIQNAIWWIESGTLDGLRLDTFVNVDRSFWQEFHAELHALYPHLTTIGDIAGRDPSVVSYFAGGVKHGGIDTGLATPFDFPGYFAMRESLATDSSASFTALVGTQRQDWLYPHPERLVTFFDNHDTPRFLAEPGETPARLKLAFGLLLTLRGMPQINYGDEIGLGAAGSENRADFPGGFAGDVSNAFLASDRTPQQDAMYRFVSGLLDLRAKNAVLQTGAQQNILVGDTGYVFTRYETQAAGKPLTSGAAMVVLANASATPKNFHLDLTNSVLEGATSLIPAWNASVTIAVDQNLCTVPVGPEQVAIFRVQR